MHAWRCTAFRGDIPAFLRTEVPPETRLTQMLPSLGDRRCLAQVSHAVSGPETRGFPGNSSPSSPSPHPRETCTWPRGLASQGFP
jgi:hypothetical protein